MILTNSIFKSFGNTKVVSNLDLSIEAGEIFAFLGENGAGKTTTIKMLVGLLEPDSGRIRIGSHWVDEEPMAAKRSFGFLPDTAFLYTQFKVYEHLEFVGKLYSLSKREIDLQIDQLLSDFNIKDRRESYIFELSHGLKQRVALCAALIHKPKLLILDEPMIGLDPQSMRLFKEKLVAYAASGTTIFMSTHLLQVAEEIATRIGIIRKGSLYALGTLSEIRQQLDSKENLEELFITSSLQA